MVDGLLGRLGVGQARADDDEALLAHWQLPWLTLEQNARLQTDALKAAGCCRVFTDRASGSLDERVELAKLFDQAHEEQRNRKSR